MIDRLLRHHSSELLCASYYSYYFHRDLIAVWLPRADSIEAIFYIQGECTEGCCDVRVQPWMGYGWEVAARCESYARQVLNEPPIQHT